MVTAILETVRGYYNIFGITSAIFGAMWALKLASNHLSHIEKSNQQIVEALRDLIVTNKVHDTHESDHHAAEMLILTALIKR